MTEDIKRNEISEVSSLSIVETVDINSMRNKLQTIKNFQTMVHENFTQNHDYGIIPGTGNKPTLLKPGAEKILMLMGLASEFEIVDSTRDFEVGFFQYQVRCILSHSGTVVTEGLGAANTKERKYIKQDPYTMDNTVLKMAKKRALVDAALLVGSLSDIFTQDIEDMDLGGNKTGQKKYATDRDGTISRAQAGRLFAIAQGNNDTVKKAMEEFGYESTADIKKIDYSKIADRVEELTPEKQEASKEEVEENEADLPWS